MSPILQKIQQFRGNPFAAYGENGVDVSQPFPAVRYALHFTPRSGSSRLADMIRIAGGLGNPDECFNPSYMPKLLQDYPSKNLETFVENIARGRSPHGVFGCEITWLQMRLAFVSHRAFDRIVRPTANVWLIREDIVAQAVSNVRMGQTGVAQSVFSDAETLAAAEAQFTYDAGAIRSSLLRLAFYEARTEASLRQAQLAPLRLSYEMVDATPSESILALIEGHIGAQHMRTAAPEPTFAKVSGAKSEDMVARFRNENARLVRWIDARRAACLERLSETRMRLGA